MSSQQVLKEYAARIGFPESGTMERIFEILYDGEQDVAVIGALPASIPEIAKKTGLREVEIKGILDRLFLRGAVGHPMRRPDIYKLFPAMIELRDSTALWPAAPQELFELWDRIIFEEVVPLVGFLKDAKPPAALRVVPIEEAVESRSTVLDIDSARKLVRDAELISLQNCACRVHARRMGRGQDCPLPSTEVCMQTNGFGESVLRRGVGRQITVAEALKILGDAEDAGLNHMTRNSTAKDTFLCNCCACCCTGFSFLKNLKYDEVFAPSRFRVRHDREACTLCGICVDRCQFGAITMTDDAVITDASRCYGCGNCVITCSSGARVLEEVRPREFIRVK
ncbi:MAG: 4Fe-4S binding protein [Deltaproteobacteria bacterium]|nr:4Fe-4S binding protein [Deltaproteobacteria bacterium]